MTGMSEAEREVVHCIERVVGYVPTGTRDLLKVLRHPDVEDATSAYFLASRDARLAAVEALADEWMGRGPSPVSGSEWRRRGSQLRGALHPDPSEASTDV